jgi:Na+-driven multidrug efflux pump
MLNDPIVHELSVRYLDYRSFGIPFVFLLFSLGGFYSGIGRTSVFIWSASVMMVANIILNYGLIFGELGLPAMGLEGAGLASMLSETLACVIIFVHAVGRRFHKHFSFFRFNRPSRRALRRIWRISAPIVLQSFTGTFGWFLFFTWIENYLGTDPLAASNVLRMIYIFFSVPARGLAGAMNTLVSNVIGQRRLRHVRTVTIKVIKASVVCTAIVVAPLVIWPREILSLMPAGEAAEAARAAGLVELSLPALTTIVIALLAMSVSTTLFRAVTGTGAVRVALRMEVIAIAVYIIYALVIIQVVGARNLAVVWTVEIVYWCVLLVLTWWYLQGGKWIKLRI